MMKFGINLPIKDWRNSLGALQKTEFRYLLLKWLNKLPANELPMFKQAIEACNCIPYSLHTSVSLFIDSPMLYDITLERTKAEIKTAFTMGVRDLTLHPPLVIDPELPATTRTEYFCRFLCELQDYINPSGSDLMISLENVWDAESAYYTPSELVDIVTKTGGNNLGLCLDSGHLNVLDLSCAETINAIPDELLQTTHLHDNDGDSDAHSLPGEGTIDWPDTLQALRDKNYQGPLVFEILPENKIALEERILSAWDIISRIEQLPLPIPQAHIPKPYDVFKERYAEAEFYFAHGKYDQAISVYQSIISESDAFSNKSHWATVKMAYIHQKQGQHQQALNYWQVMHEKNRLAMFDGLAEKVLQQL